MFAEIKAMIQNQISGDDYDREIVLWINAGVADLTKTDQIVLPGDCDITAVQNEQTGVWTVTDNSTITDKLVFAALATYCSMNIGNPPNIDYMERTYASLKKSMRTSKVYKASEGATTE